MQKELLWSATKRKYEGTYAYVKSLQVKDKRSLFTVLRTHEGVEVDTFLPAFGLHVGDFSLFQILTESSRREKRDGGGVDPVVIPSTAAQARPT
jgi:hypothetical protein